ncbi:hypothetical protein SHAM105786_07380 [Shewanella amazonensis]|uniref:Uncharacterized protein n=1 Tax=Shewanella amazonensis (strain ATCC BAA-1098 / SB2B) TaxID=326297 RepID=A1S3I6_SHEAM|nr:hypothetical protein [Shewanella amazonensis]ABL98942.1 conserved hypothetical protein [Shewanella amazonensis SB2B]
MTHESTHQEGHREKADRRQGSPSNLDHWNKLTTAQRFAFYTLAKLGYQLLFVRGQQSQPLAITRQDERLATINSWGDIDFAPDIQLRH